MRDTYDGGWVEGKREGQGVQAQASGLRSYEGGWHLDQRSVRVRVRVTVRVRP